MPLLRPALTRPSIKVLLLLDVDAHVASARIGCLVPLFRIESNVFVVFEPVVGVRDLAIHDCRIDIADCIDLLGGICLARGRSRWQLRVTLLAKARFDLLAVPGRHC